MIRDIHIKDAPSIADIYNYYIKNTWITFEEDILKPEDMESQIKTHDIHLPWIVLEEDNTILGYAYASKWKSRCAYKYSVESSIYLHKNHFYKGLGTLLYQELINRLNNGQNHAVIGGIALPNRGSIALHEKLGFKKVAHFNEVGFKFNQWIDVGYWELIL